MNDEQTVQYLVMQALEEDCIINAKEKRMSLSGYIRTELLNN